MNKNTVLALAAGLFGGLLTHYIAPPVAFAQNQAPPTPISVTPMEIRARSFTLVDQTDRPAGTFSVERDRLNRVRIVLRDFNGREIWAAGGSGMQPLSLR